MDEGCFLMPRCHRPACSRRYAALRPARATAEAAAAPALAPAPGSGSWSQDHDVAAASRGVAEWLSAQPLEELIPRQAAVELAASARGTVNFKYLAGGFADLLAHGEGRARGEKRTLRTLLGAEASRQACDAAVLAAECLDEETARDFLRSPTVEAILGAIMYEAIFEFVKSTDFLGSFVNGLPILGPLRQELMATIVREVDRRLGGSIKSFLGTYARTASERLTTMVLNNDTRRELGRTVRNVAEDTLDRTIADLVPPPHTTASLRKMLANVSLPGATGSEVLVDVLYDSLGGEPLGSYFLRNTTAVTSDGTHLEDQGLLRSAPQLGPLASEALAAALERFVRSPEGQDALVHIVRAALARPPPAAAQPSAEEGRGVETPPGRPPAPLAHPPLLSCPPPAAALRHGAGSGSDRFAPAGG